MATRWSAEDYATHSEGQYRWALALETLAPYMRGVQLAMSGIAERLRDAWDREQVARTAAMAARYVKAQAATRTLKQPR